MEANKLKRAFQNEDLERMNEIANKIESKLQECENDINGNEEDNLQNLDHKQISMVDEKKSVINAINKMVNQFNENNKQVKEMIKNQKTEKEMSDLI